MRLLRPFGRHEPGTEGTVIEIRSSRLNGHDCAVRFDGSPDAFFMDLDEIEPVWVGAAEQETHE